MTDRYVPSVDETDAPSSGQVLVWDPEAGKYRPSTVSGGGGGEGYLATSGDQTHTGLLILRQSAAPLALQQQGYPGTPGTKDPGWCHMNFLDAEGDRTAWFGINENGDLNLQPEIPGAVVRANNSPVLVVGDMGPGGGIDADTLDGQHASDFLAAIGGVIAGQLRIDTGNSAPLILRSTDTGGSAGPTDPDANWQSILFQDAQGDELGGIGIDPAGHLAVWSKEPGTGLRYWGSDDIEHTVLHSGNAANMMVAVAVVSDLRALNGFDAAVPGVALVLGKDVHNDGMQRTFSWSAANGDPDDGEYVVKPTAVDAGSPGRWVISNRGGYTWHNTSDQQLGPSVGHVNFFYGTLTADQTVLLPSSAHYGKEYFLSRVGGGDFNINVYSGGTLGAPTGLLASLGLEDWVRFIWEGTWVLVARGSRVETTGGGGHAVYEETTLLPQRSKLRFFGTGVTAADNAGEDATDLTISGSGGGASAAVDVTYAGSANLSATNVEGALDELDTEKASASALSDHLSDADAAHAAAAISYAGSANLAATNVEGALDELDTEKAAAAVVTDHLSDASDAHDASAISYAGSANLAATDVEAALDELDTEKVAASALTAHVDDADDAHDASAISYAGGTGIAATNVEAAIDEVATEKADKNTLSHLPAAAKTDYERLYFAGAVAQNVETGPLRVPRASVLRRIFIDVGDLVTGTAGTVDVYKNRKGGAAGTVITTVTIPVSTAQPTTVADLNHALGDPDSISLVWTSATPTAGGRVAFTLEMERTA